MLWLANRSLRQRLTLFPTLMAVALSLAFVVTFAVIDHGMARRAMVRDLERVADLLAAHSFAPGRASPGADHDAVALLRQWPAIEAVVLLSNDGSLRARYRRDQPPGWDPLTEPSFLEETRDAAARPRPGARFTSNRLVVTRAVPPGRQEPLVPADATSLLLVSDMSALWHRALRLALTGLAMLALMTPLSLWMASRAQRTLHEPLESLAALVRRETDEHQDPAHSSPDDPALSHSDSSSRSHSDGPHDLERLVAGFHEMLRTIERREAALREAHDDLELHVEERTHALTEEIARRRSTEKELVEARDAAEALGRTKADFLANMSHEIRTPLIGVIGMAELLRDTELNDTQGQFVDTLVGSGQHLLALVNDILDLSKLAADGIELEHTRFDLRDVVYEAADLIGVQAGDKDVELLVHYPAHVPRHVRGDPARMRQVLTNLLGNAMKFTEHGHVLLDVSFEVLLRREAMLCITVEDTGIGIASDKLSTIFDKFSQADASTTRQYGGTGLGLPIARSLVELMTSTIQVESEPGQGTRFTVTVPFELVDEEPPDVDAEWTGRRALLDTKPGVSRVILEAELLYLGVESVPRESDAILWDELMTPSRRYDVLVLQQSGGEVVDLLRRIRDEPELDTMGIVLLTDFRGRVRLPAAVVELVDAVLVCPWRAQRLQVALTGMAETRWDPMPESNDDGSQSPIFARVLLVDDEAVNRRIGRSMLERLGCRVELARDGHEALRQVHQRPFDLVLLDCSMPEMDGRSTARAIRGEPLGGELPIIGLRTPDEHGLEPACLAAGMDAVVSKPLGISRLQGILDRYLVGSPTGVVP